MLMRRSYKHSESIRLMSFKLKEVAKDLTLHRNRSLTLAFESGAIYLGTYGKVTSSVSHL